MSLINDLMQRVASLTNRLNEIGANSKRTEEMPLMNPVDRNSLLRVSKGGVSYKIPVQGIVDELSLPNEVIQIGLLEVVPDGLGESLKIPDTPTPIWRINGQEFLKNTETLVPIPYAANDKYRTDLVVADTNSDFYRVEGTEGDFLGLAPNIPANTVEVTRINIFGNQIGNPSPTPTNGFVTKSSKQYRSVNLNSTSPTKLYLSHESTTFDIQNSVLNGSIGGFYSFSSDNDGYDGLDIYIKNSNANPITIVHNESTASTPFNLPSGIDIVLQENHIAHFKLNKADEVVELVGVASGGGGVGLYTIPQSGTDIGKLDLSNPLGLDATTLINEVESLSIKSGSVVGGNITFRSRTTLRPTIAGATEQVYLSEPSANFDNTATYTIVVWKEANKINWLMRKRS